MCGKIYGYMLIYAENISKKIQEKQVALLQVALFASLRGDKEIGGRSILILFVTLFI